MTETKDDSSFNPSSQASSAAPAEDQAAQALKSSVLADAHDLGDGAKHLAGDAVAKARESAQTQITGGKDRLADGLGSVAEAIRHTGDHLRERDQSGLTDYVARAADGVEAASDYLKEKSIGDVLGDVGAFARREPALFLGGAFVLGLLGGRFLKSSNQKPPMPSNRLGSVGDVASAPAGQASARPNGQRSQRAKETTSRNQRSTPILSSGTQPIAGEKPREIEGVRGSRPDDGANLPGTL